MSVVILSNQLNVIFSVIGFGNLLDYLSPFCLQLTDWTFPSYSSFFCSRLSRPGPLSLTMLCSWYITWRNIFYFISCHWKIKFRGCFLIWAIVGFAQYILYFLLLQMDHWHLRSLRLVSRVGKTLVKFKKVSSFHHKDAILLSVVSSFIAFIIKMLYCYQCELTVCHSVSVMQLLVIFLVSNFQSPKAILSNITVHNL